MYLESPGRMRFVLIVTMTVLSITVGQAHGDIHIAISEVTEQIRTDPNNGSLYLKRAQYYQIDGNFELAMVDYLVAEQLDSTLTVVKYHLATLCLDHNLLERGMFYINTFLDLHPDHPKGRYVRSLISIALDQNRPALDDLRIAISLLDNPEPSHFMLAAEAELQIPGPDQLQRALSWYTLGEEYLGFNIVLSQMYAQTAAEHGAYDLALDKIDEIMRHFHRKEKWLLIKGEILESAGYRVEAYIHFARAVSEISDLPPKYRNTRAIMYIEQAAIAGIERLEASRE